MIELGPAELTIAPTLGSGFAEIQSLAAPGAARAFARACRLVLLQRHGSDGRAIPRGSDRPATTELCDPHNPAAADRRPRIRGVALPRWTNPRTAGDADSLAALSLNLRPRARRRCPTLAMVGRVVRAVRPEGIQRERREVAAGGCSYGCWPRNLMLDRRGPRGDWATVRRHRRRNRDLATVSVISRRHAASRFGGRAACRSRQGRSPCARRIAGPGRAASAPSRAARRVSPEIWFAAAASALARRTADRGVEHRPCARSTCSSARGRAARARRGGHASFVPMYSRTAFSTICSTTSAWTAARRAHPLRWCSAPVAAGVGVDHHP